MQAAPMKRFQLHVVPTTPVGRRALIAAGVAVLCSMLAPPFGLIPEGSFYWIRVVGLNVFFTLAFVATLLGSALALTAIIRDHERALGVYVPLLLLAMYVWIVVAQVFFGAEA